MHSNSMLLDDPQLPVDAVSLNDIGKPGGHGFQVNTPVDGTERF